MVGEEKENFKERQVLGQNPADMPFTRVQAQDRQVNVVNVG
jgi:hypothetical protein